MDAGQETTVTMVIFAGAVASVAMWLMGFYAPALMATATPAVTAAITTVFVGVISFVAPAWKLGGSKPPQQ